MRILLALLLCACVPQKPPHPLPSRTFPDAYQHPKLCLNYGSKPTPCKPGFPKVICYYGPKLVPCPSPFAVKRKRN